MYKPENQKNPEVTLINWTNNPEKTIGLAVQAWTSDNFSTDLSEISDDEARKLTRKALKAFHRTALEYVSMTFVIKNVSRAFQQQLTRTRLASYAIQSMRVVTKKGFAENQHYTMPPGLTENQKEAFHVAMLTTEKFYHGLIQGGMSVENARGILPLNIHSDVTMTINLNSLYHMSQQRLCLNTQWEYRQVVLQIRNEIREKMGELFARAMKAPCIGHDHCVVREFCGVYMYASTASEEERDHAYKRYEEMEVKK